MSTDDRLSAFVTGCSEPDRLGANIALQLAHKGYRTFASERKIKIMSFLAGVCEQHGAWFASSQRLMRVGVIGGMEGFDRWHEE